MVGNIGILYEDPYILVCRKPAGVPVQSANSRVKDMVSILKLYLLEVRETGGAISWSCASLRSAGPGRDCICQDKTGSSEFKQSDCRPEGQRSGRETILCSCA